MTTSPHRPLWQDLGLRALRFGALLYAVLALFGWFGTDRLIYLPPPLVPDEYPQQLQQLATREGDQVAAVWRPAKPALSNGYTLLFHHGNGEHLGTLPPLLEQLNQLGFSVLAYDYPGYGRSTGSASERTVLAAAEAAYIHARRELDIPAANLLMYGRSLGSGPATHLAANREVGGLIIESGYASIFLVRLPWRVLPFDKYPNIDTIDRVRSPVLILHGRGDPLIPHWHAELLASRIKSKHRLMSFDSDGHADLPWEARAAYEAALMNFVRDLPASGPATASQ